MPPYLYTREIDAADFLIRRPFSRPETVLDFGLAGDEKVWERIELLVAGARGAGIHQLGYAVENVLKVASFVRDGVRSHDLVQPGLGPHPNSAQVRFGSAPTIAYRGCRDRARECVTSHARARFGMVVPQPDPRGAVPVT